MFFTSLGTTLVGALLAICGVQAGFGPNQQNWGYVTIREQAHMFWWLHYTTATDNYTDRPLVIWLQGGPGGSSTGIGNFHEIGPWDVNQQSREISWVHYLNVLFVDNPVGTGYSYVEDASNASLFASDNAAIADDFSVLLQGFLEQNSEFRSVPLYIFGQSYGGKMTVDIALKLHEEIQQGRLTCNFKGIGLGDPWISPIDSLASWPEYLFNLGFIDPLEYSLARIVTDTAKTEINSGNFERATAYFQTAQVFINSLTTVDYYNIMLPQNASSSQYKDWKMPINVTEAIAILNDLNINTSRLEEQHHNIELKRDKHEALVNLMQGPVASNLNLEDIPIKWGDQRENVFQAVNLDFMKPATESLERVLTETDLEVTVYNGQLDLIVSVPGTMKWLEQLQWPNAENWKNAAKEPIIIDNTIEGYSKSYGNFRFCWIHRAGHSVPQDKPDTMEFVLSEAVNNYKVN